MKKDKKKKKIILILFLVLLLIFILGNATIFFFFPDILTGNTIKTISASNSVYLYPSEIKVDKDKNFVINVEINSSEEINKVQFELDYSNIINAVKVEQGDFFQQAFPVTSINKGRIVLISAGASGRGEGSLFRITFNSISSGTTNLEIKNFKAYIQDKEVALDVINGKVTVN